MSDTRPASANDGFARYSRWALSGAILIAATSVGYRIASDRTVSAAAVAQQEEAQVTEAQQRAMAEGMVAQLEGKLREQPDRIDGWILLIRSRVSLGQPDKAKAALDEAIKANPAAADEIKAQAAALGVE